MKRGRALFLLSLALLPLLAYLPSLKHELIWDSRPMILENDLLRGSRSPAAPFLSGYWATTSQRSGGGYDYYRPLTVLSFMAERALWGLSPWRLRLVNLLLFIAALFCLYFFLRRQTSRPWAAETAVLLFALFPLHLDNVNWVVGRCDLLMLLFGVLALLLFDRYLEGRRPLAGLLALATYALALLAKESSIFFLPLFPLHGLIRRRRFSLPLFIPPLAATAAYWLLKSSVIGRGGFPIRPFAPFWENVAQPLAALGYYGRSLAFPFRYDMFLPLDAVRTAPYLAAGALLALLLVLVPAFALHGRERNAPGRGEWLGAWFWIAPFLGGALLMLFTPIYPFSISTRYLLVPAVGWTWFLGHRLAALPPRTGRAALALLLAASAVSLTVHSRKYRSEADFWRTALAARPGDSFFLAKYAGQLVHSGDLSGGESLLRRALSSTMRGPTAVVVSLQLADITFARARYEESLEWLEKARGLKLDLPYARHRWQRLLAIHRARNDLPAAEAVLAELSGALPAPQVAQIRLETYLAFAEWDRARTAARAMTPPLAREWAAAIGREEGAFPALAPGERARFFIRRGNFAAAWAAWPQKDDPGIAPQLQAARLALLAGQAAEGRRRLDRLAREHGSDFRVLNSAGNLLFELQRADEALAFYRLSLRLNPGQPALAERVERIGRTRYRPPEPPPAARD